MGKFASGQVGKFASGQVGKWASLQGGKFASWQVGKFASGQGCWGVVGSVAEKLGMGLDRLLFYLGNKALQSQSSTKFDFGAKIVTKPCGRLNKLGGVFQVGKRIGNGLADIYHNL